MVDLYITWFSAQVQKLKSTRNRQDSTSNPQEHILWSLLAGKAAPDRVGFKQLLECPSHIYYREYSWMIGGSYLLLALDPACFTNLMAETRSPLMLSCLTEYLSMEPWSGSLFRCLLNCENFCVRLLAVHWPIHLLEQNVEKGLTFQTVLPLLDSLEPDLRLLQSTRLLSEAAFYIRNPKRTSNHWPALLPVLIDYAAAALPLSPL